jgi:hypothetical protein
MSAEVLQGNTVAVKCRSGLGTHLWFTHTLKERCTILCLQILSSLVLQLGPSFVPLNLIVETLNPQSETRDIIKGLNPQS